MKKSYVWLVEERSVPKLRATFATGEVFQADEEVGDELVAQRLAAVAAEEEPTPEDPEPPAPEGDPEE